jgi:hypothetical protein
VPFRYNLAECQHDSNSAQVLPLARCGATVGHIPISQGHDLDRRDLELALSSEAVLDRVHTASDWKHPGTKTVDPSVFRVKASDEHDGAAGQVVVGPGYPSKRVDVGGARFRLRFEVGVPLADVVALFAELCCSLVYLPLNVFDVASTDRRRPNRVGSWFGCSYGNSSSLRIDISYQDAARLSVLRGFGQLNDTFTNLWADEKLDNLRFLASYTTVTGRAISGRG